VFVGVYNTPHPFYGAAAVIVKKRQRTLTEEGNKHMSSIVLNVHVGTPKRLTQRAQITLQDHGGTTESAMKAAIEYLTWVEWDALQGVDNMARVTSNALLGAFVNRFLYEITADTPEPAQETGAYGGVDGENDYPSFKYADQYLGESFDRLYSLPEQYRFDPDEGVISFVNTNNRWEQSSADAEYSTDLNIIFDEHGNLDFEASNVFGVEFRHCMPRSTVRGRFVPTRLPHGLEVYLREEVEDRQYQYGGEDYEEYHVDMELCYASYNSDYERLSNLIPGFPDHVHEEIELTPEEEQRLPHEIEEYGEAVTLTAKYEEISERMAHELTQKAGLTDDEVTFVPVSAW